MSIRAKAVLCGVGVLALVGFSAKAASAQSSTPDLFGAATQTTASQTGAGGQQTSGQSATAQAVAQNIVTCTSQPGTREHCPADTSVGVTLVRSTGQSACLLGKTWGYDDTGIWVSDGCAAQFYAGVLKTPPTKAKPLEHIPNIGFLLYDGDQGQIYFRLFTYARYLNQRNLDPSYVDAFGKSHDIPLRQDMQLQKFFAPFSGWYLTPKFRYYLYVWSANTSQGDPAQVVGGGNISYTFNRYATAGFGITSLPSVRSTEGQFPLWLGVDDRLIADEFFRGSYTTGAWLKGEIATKFKYMAMIANNLSTLGVSAAQLDNHFNTQSYMLQWLPTTGEFGLYGTFGDYDWHEKVATRVAAHYSYSREEKQSQPGTDAIENSQIRLADGSIIFTPNLFAPGTTVDTVRYQMVSIDGGVKYKGASAEGEFYWRDLSDFTGTNTGFLVPIHDRGYQMQTSAMAVPKILQLYFSWSQIFGDYGNPWEWRAGENWYFMKDRGLRLNGEFIHISHSPVGYTAYPMPVGANGNLFHLNLEMNF